ncbi:MAG: leucyl aminopeptidase family protein [Alphaproteobacteria bacterium]|nr:leucyl aminopeptidase family protein [Alphaproteobacteria bacterium]
MPHKLIARSRKDTVPVSVVATANIAAWLRKLPKAQRDWLSQSGFTGKKGSHALLPGARGGVARAVFVTDKGTDLWSWSGLAAALPKASYRLEGRLAKAAANDAALGWGLAAYEFTKYRRARLDRPELVWPAAADRAAVTRTLNATALVRDLINTPAEDMGPSQLTAAARALGRRFAARTKVITGDALLKANYPMIHMVGRASDDAPRLIDMRWGNRGPRVTLVGKGVCFDTGGLDLKPAAGMLRMKKDMAGAAHVLGLASMIMAAKLPVRLRVLIGAVENAVAGNAYRPWDVLATRKGITVENANTDAEGRLVLGDCLAEASRETPDLLLDYATLTGASRVAVGVELAALYCNDDTLAKDLEKHGHGAADPLWRLPLHRPYRRMLDSKVADISSASEGGFGGGITAALFLEEFVDDGIPWAHFDIMAWNLSTRPGRPEGGDAQAMRAAFALISERFGR